MRRLAILALAAASSACAHNAQADQLAQQALAAPGIAYNAARRAAAPPQLSPVANPAALTGGQAQSIPTPQLVSAEPAGPGSLWRAGSRNFFNDQRASKVGDILTVAVEISDKAEVSNSSNRSRSATTTAGVNHFFGLEHAFGGLFNSHFDPTALVDASSDSTHTGAGAINREEKINLNLAAFIVDRLPNGNLVIAGRQEVRINSEIREVTVSGVIRPEDISAENTISQDQIAEARISYGGRGQISAVQRPNIGQRITDAITPW